MSPSDSSKMKLPLNYFMQWLRENISAGKIRFDLRFDDKGRYLDNFLAGEIDKWKPENPIVVSAQTGAGKNYFIQRTLLPKLIEENPTEDNLILILSNRIALNRQNKHKLAELLVEYKHNEKYLFEIKNFYTPEGVDHIYINFDVVTVCSYHQLYKRCIHPAKAINDPNFISSIDISKFKYIICDECHFFTSDASFNKETDKVLKEIVSQGQNAVRVYMSATPEVALEAILREEFFASQMKFDFDVRRVDKDLKAKENVLGFYEVMFPKKSRNKKLRKIISADRSVLSELREKEYGFSENNVLSLNFYYMARNYDYVIPHFYRQNDELLDFVRNSKDKWIIFTNFDGSNIDKMLDKNNVSSIFLSRKGIEKGGDKKKAYDYIIHHETTDRKVLITTSILDNGINITNEQLKNSSDKVLNIAIDSFDRIEFIQMLGRIRAEKDFSVQLYIKEYSLSRLKKLFQNDARLLVQFLEGKMYASFSHDFNPCAVYHLVNRMSTMLAVIRNKEPDFCVKFSLPEEEARKGSIYEFYKTGEGRNEHWSRSVVDLLESFIESDKRKRYIEEDIENGVRDVTRHESKLTDTFISYLYGELIPLYYESAINTKYDFYVNQLSEREHNRYEHLISLAERDKGTLSVVEKIEILSNEFDFIAKDVFINIDLIRRLSERAVYYRRLADRLYGENFSDEQLNWLEKYITDFSTASAEDFITNEETNEETIEEYILSHHVSQSDIDKHLNGNYINKDFISAKGAKKDEDIANDISKRFFQGKQLKELLNKVWNIKDHKYVLKSFRSEGHGHPTYYCFVKIEDSLS